ncbi:MAG: hypothetical protein ACR2KK_05465 [Acidimicrobiales bacterium]
MKEPDERRVGTLRRALVAATALCVALVGHQTIAGAAGETIATVAGTGVPGDTGDGGPATVARINQPRSVFVTSDGGYVFAEPFTHRVRRVAANGIITTVAGTGTAGFSGDGGPATRAQLNFTHAAAPTADGGLLLADTFNNRIRKVSAQGIITTVAGNGAEPYNGDNRPATQASISRPRGVTAMADGGFLIPDSGNNRIRRVWPSGIITTVAGTGQAGFSGDSGQATRATLNMPFGATPTADGGFLVADTANQRIRKVSPGGTITTVAGTGTAGYAGDGGPATLSRLYYPHNVVALPAASFFIADTANNRLRRVDSYGKIVTIAGNGVQGYGGDGGLAVNASLNYPKAMAVASGGRVLIADEGNHRIRLTSPAGATSTTTTTPHAAAAEPDNSLTTSAPMTSGRPPTTKGAPCEAIQRRIFQAADLQAVQALAAAYASSGCGTALT